jgi:hypothetical protein
LVDSFEISDESDDEEKLKKKNLIKSLTKNSLLKNDSITLHKIGSLKVKSKSRPLLLKDEAYFLKSFNNNKENFKELKNLSTDLISPRELDDSFEKLIKLIKF